MAAVATGFKHTLSGLIVAASGEIRTLLDNLVYIEGSKHPHDKDSYNKPILSY